MSNNDTFSKLMAVIEDRRKYPSDESYTTSLMRSGTSNINAKILEEANELVEAADEPGAAGQKHIVREAADLVYHLFVLLARSDIPLDRLEAELRRRSGVSGLEEKASREPGGKIDE